MWVRRSSGRLSAANGNWGATTSLSVGGGEGHADTLGGKLEVEELPDKEAAEERRAASLSSRLTTRISSGVEAEGATAGLGIRDDCMRREQRVAMRLARRRRPATSACHAEKASARGSNPGLPWRAEGASVASEKGAGPGFARVIPRLSATAERTSAASERRARNEDTVAAMCSVGCVSTSGSSAWVSSDGTRLGCEGSGRSESATEVSRLS